MLKYKNTIYIEIFGFILLRFNISFNISLFSLFNNIYFKFIQPVKISSIVLIESEF